MFIQTLQTFISLHVCVIYTVLMLELTRLLLKLISAVFNICTVFVLLLGM